jgi:ABC-type sugar transport system ATPase subunit
MDRVVTIGEDPALPGVEDRRGPVREPGRVADAHVVLDARGISKRYGNVIALDSVDLEVHAREVVGIVGDNGAGKSTLVRILSGAIQPDHGTIRVGNSSVVLSSPVVARRLGIETVYQELALAPDLTVSENMFLGREIKRRGLLGRVGWLNRKAMNRAAEQQLAKLRIRVSSVRAPCESLSGGQRQAVAVARATAWGTRLVLMDEPTAALGVEQQRRVGELIGDLRSSGVPVVLISHNMPQVHEICDRVLVLFHGRVAADVATEDVSIQDIVAWITGVPPELPRDDPG